MIENIRNTCLDQGKPTSSGQGLSLPPNKLTFNSFQKRILLIPSDTIHNSIMPLNTKTKLEKRRINIRPIKDIISLFQAKQKRDSDPANNGSDSSMEGGEVRCPALEHKDLTLDKPRYIL
ncbi:unnamed protein product [Prunus brigantina]